MSGFALVAFVVYLAVFCAFAGHELLDRKESNYIVAPPVWHELLAAALWPAVVPTAFAYRTWKRRQRRKARRAYEEAQEAAATHEGVEK